MDMTSPGDTPEAEVPVSSDDDDMRGGHIPEGPRPSQMSLPPDAKGSTPQEHQEGDQDSAE